MNAFNLHNASSGLNGFSSLCLPGLANASGLGTGCCSLNSSALANAALGSDSPNVYGLPNAHS